MSGMMLAFAGGSYGAAPVNTVAPVVSGTATFGQTLTTTNGTWTGAPAPTFTYQWQRVTTNISGATSSTYVLVAADVGNTIRCVVKATNTIAPSGVTANSNSTASVAATVPGAPTIGTATQTGSSTATVVYTAPASNGGATITSYTATSSPSSITGTLSQAGSGTITVSGLAPSTSYTFTVTATNSAGTSAASGASNSITTTAATGQQAFTTAGSFTWVAPAGVTSISIVAVGGGQGGTNYSFSNGPGIGGSLAYKNNQAVTPGTSYAVVVGAGGIGATIADRPLGGSSTVTTFVKASGGGRDETDPSVGTASFTGGLSGTQGGKGAGGYAGAGGNGSSSSGAAGSAGTGGSGGGGGGVVVTDKYGSNTGGGNGGGVGILGQGTNGTAGAAAAGNGGAGSGGSGQTYGGGGRSGGTTFGCCCTYDPSPGGAGGVGAVRIIWPGTTRYFPSTNTGDM